MWELLSNTKKLCWRVWLAFTSIITGLTLLQTISGRLGDITLFVWLWAGITLLPGFMMVFVSVLRDRQTSKAVPREAHYVLWLGSLAYLLIVLGTILLEGIATSRALSIYEYRLQSFAWTVPVEVLLMVGYALVFYKKQPLFRSDEQSIRGLASTQAQKWGKKQQKLKETCFELVAEGKLEKAFSTARKYMEENGSGNLNKALLLENQLSETRQRAEQQLISREESEKVTRRITLAFMNMINMQ